MNVAEPIRVLLVESNPFHAQALGEALLEAAPSRGLPTFRVTHRDRLLPALERLDAGDIDVLLLDLALPDATGRDALARARAKAPDVPVVVLMGREDDAMALEVMQAGAQDCVPKEALNPRRLTRSIMGAIERHQVVRALLRSSDAFREVVEKAPYGVAVLREGKILFANPALASYLHCEGPPELVGKTLMELLHPEERAAAAARMRSGEPTNGNGTISAGEYRTVERDGEVGTLEVSAGGEVEFEGAPATLLVARDVTERRKVQERLILADRMASIGTLAAGIAHEINNPLTYVLGNLDLVSMQLRKIAASIPEGRLDEVERFLEDTRSGGERIKLIVRNLRTLAHADEGETGLVDVRRVLENVINMVRNEVRHRAQLTTSMEDVPQVKGNGARLAQVFLHLLVNAVQALPEGRAAEHEIAVATGTDAAGRAYVEVRDTGCGIPPEVRPRIFDPFFTTKPPGVGTGLGLSICHSIVTALGGEISVKSKMGEGTTIRVVLPAAAAEPTGPGTAEAPPAPTPSARPARRGRILVIEDEPGVRTLFAHLLEDEFDIITLGSGREAIELLDVDAAFDAVVCDVMMPDVSGVDVYERVSAARPGFERSFIFITGGPFSRRAQKFLATVENRCLQKPFDLRELEALLRERVPKS